MSYELGRVGDVATALPRLMTGSAKNKKTRTLKYKNTKSPDK